MCLSLSSSILQGFLLLAPGVALDQLHPLLRIVMSILCALGQVSKSDGPLHRRGAIAELLGARAKSHLLSAFLPSLKHAPDPNKAELALD